MAAARIVRRGCTNFFETTVATTDERAWMSELVAIVVNPTKFDDTGELRAATQARAELAGSRLRWFETTPSDPGNDVTGRALDDGCSLVIACGGDGTITACADAVVRADASVRLGVVPSGTGNLFARNLGLPLGLADALDVAFGKHTRKVDVLQCEDRHFLVMAGLGLDAALIRDTSDSLKAKVGWPAYIGGLARSVGGTGRLYFTIEVDDQQPLHAAAVGVLVGNVGHLQGGIQLLPDASPDDGLLDVIVLAPRTPAQWIGLVARTLTRRAAQSRATAVAQGRRVMISTDLPAPVEFDGEFSGEADRLDVSVSAAALTLCCPAPAP